MSLMDLHCLQRLLADDTRKNWDNVTIIILSGSLFQLSLDMHYTEDEIYELSLAREPRNSLSSVSSIFFYSYPKKRRNCYLD